MAKSDSARTKQRHSPEFAQSAFHKYAGKLLSYLDRRLGLLEDAEDVAQEVYLQLLQLDPEREVRNPLGYLYGVASRVLARHLEATRRAQERFPSAGDVSEIDFEVISGALANRLEESLEIEQQIEEALAQLPPMKAAALLLHHRDGLSHKQVAAELGLSLDTVKKYIRVAHLALRMEGWK
jgi:RNA polymerase sigma-70 factor (ECF subfamily)